MHGSRVSELDKSTQEETLDDIFEIYQKEIAFDTNLIERELEEENFEIMERKGVLAS